MGDSSRLVRRSPILSPFPEMGWGPSLSPFDLLERFSSLSPGMKEEGEGSFSPLVDITENEDSYLIHAEVPGIAKEDIQLEIKDQVLTLRGKKESRTEKTEGREGNQVHWIERRYGSFRRSFQLPKDATAEGVTAKSEEGVLEVRIPKREEVTPKTIPVTD